MGKAFESIRRGLTEAIGPAKGKQASVRTMRARRSQSARNDTADCAIANALRERAGELKRGDDTCQRAARIVECVGADLNLTHSADPILTRGWGLAA